MKAIVTIGGGEIRTKGTLAIDREILRLSGKKHPRLLFLPTASSDSEGYWKLIQKYFGTYLKCKTDVLWLIRERPSSQEMRKKILSSDVIYVGGGNTRRMMRLWKRRGVDKVLRTAYERGIVLCGISAGSICWFDSGHSDFMSLYNPRRWEYMNVKGMGFIRGIHCPHYNSATRGVKRRKKFQEMIQKTGGLGLAITDNCAIEWINGTYRVIASKDWANAFRVYKRNGKVISETIEKTEEFSPMRRLYQRA